jgi:WhiB family redox-sensing transcriptional regulator
VRETLSWQAHARCLEVDPEIFFPERGGSGAAARAVCNQCHVRAACLRYALSNREETGIWGGTSGRERRKLKKKAS